MTTWRWIKNDTCSLNKTGSILRFTPLKLFDAGQYTCIVNEIFNSSQNIIIQSELAIYII